MEDKKWQCKNAKGWRGKTGPAQTAFSPLTQHFSYFFPSFPFLNFFCTFDKSLLTTHQTSSWPIPHKIQWTCSEGSTRPSDRLGLLCIAQLEVQRFYGGKRGKYVIAVHSVLASVERGNCLMTDRWHTLTGYNISNTMSWLVTFLFSLLHHLRAQGCIHRM